MSLSRYRGPRLLLGCVTTETDMSVFISIISLKLDNKRMETIRFDKHLEVITIQSKQGMGAFWRGVRSDRKIMTGNMFLVMRQNDFGHDQDRDFIRVFKYCYISVKKYLQGVHLLNV